MRACSRAWLEEIGRYAASERLPLHIHADEQPREIEECLAEHGCRPIELLADTGCLTARTTIVHATHASDDELDLLAAAGARICACPTTEADLGDGFLRVAAVRERVDPALHRLGLEHADRPARGAPRARGHRAPPDRPARHPLDRRAARDRLDRGRARAAARRLGRRSSRPRTTARSPASLPEHVTAALIAGCAADVVVAGERLSTMDVTEATFERDVIARSAETPVLVDFWAEWCGPCHALAPVLEAAVEARAVPSTLVKVDVDANPALSQRYLRQRHPGGEGVPGRPGRRRVHRRAVARPPSTPSSTSCSRRRAPTRCSRSFAPPASSRTSSPRSTPATSRARFGSSSRPCPRPTADERERLREVAVALFERLGPDDPLVGTYRRRLAAALY